MVGPGDGGSVVADVAVSRRQVVAAQYIRGAALVFAGQPGAGLGICLGASRGGSLPGRPGWVLDRFVTTRENAGKCGPGLLQRSVAKPWC